MRIEKVTPLSPHNYRMRIGKPSRLDAERDGQLNASDCLKFYSMLEEWTRRRQQLNGY